MHGDWFYMTDYTVFGHEVKATERYPPDNLTRWIITQSKGFTKNGTEKISRSVDRHDPAEIPIPHNLKMLTERRNDEKLTITFLIVGWIVDLLLIIFGRK